VLRRSGWNSEIAENGAAAISLLQANTYGAVVLDMMMPEVGGRDVIDYLAGSEHDVPVIICSAAGPAALSGFDPRIVRAVVRKPFDVDHFVEAVRTFSKRA
jgi:DNA-binding response OmpR family regulator